MTAHLYSNSIDRASEELNQRLSQLTIEQYRKDRRTSRVRTVVIVLFGAAAAKISIPIVQEGGLGTIQLWLMSFVVVSISAGLISYLPLSLGGRLRNRYRSGATVLLEYLDERTEQELKLLSVERKKSKHMNPASEDRYVFHYLGDRRSFREGLLAGITTNRPRGS